MHVDVVPGVVGDHDLITVIAENIKPQRAPVTKVVRDLSNYSGDTCSYLSHAPTLNTLL